MRRRLFNFAAAVSLVVFLLTSVLWLRAQWNPRYDRLVFVRVLPDDLGVRYELGFMTAGYSVRRFPDPVGRGESRGGWRWYSTKMAVHDRASMDSYYRWVGARRIGILGSAHERKNYGPVTEVFLAYWLVAWLTPILPVAWLLARWRRRRAIVEGRCANCGYDLRATPEQCPECGTVAAKAEG